MVAYIPSIPSNANSSSGYSHNLRCFVQSYESGDLLDSSILIAPLVFFISPNDPRFLRTIDRILQSPEKGGLTSTGLVYRYNTEQSEDGMFQTSINCVLSLIFPSRCRRSRRRFQYVHILAC
jgi:GH15 family glucan-1,4-alpha-glucosidase